MISKRSRSIILDVLDGHTSTSALAKKYHVSSRMIINDLENIDYFLVSKGFPSMTRLRNGKIKRYDYFTSEVLNLINSDKVVISSYLPDERELEILYLLFVSEGFVKLDELAEKLSVSKSTVANDVDKLREKCLSFDVDIVGGKQGLSISGDEFDIRVMIANLFISYMDTYAVFDTAKILLDKDLHTTYKVFWRIFENIDITLLTDAIEIIKSSMAVNLQDNLYLYVAGLLSLMIKRHQLGFRCRIFTSDSLIASCAANMMIDFLNRSLETKSLIEEYDFILHILEVSSHELYKYHRSDLDRSEGLAKKVVQCVYDRLDLRMTYESELEKLISEEFRLIHMETLLRIPTVRNIVNIRIAQNDHIFHELRDICTGAFEFDMTDDHLWRIAAHVIDVGNRNQYTAKKNVIIVSDKPQLMSISLKKNLIALFNVHVIAIVGLGLLRRYMNLFHADFIISTVNIGLNESFTCPLIKVHPLLSEDDIRRLKQDLPLKYDESKTLQVADMSKVISNPIQLRNLADEKTFLNMVADLLYRSRYVTTQIQDFLTYLYTRSKRFGIVKGQTLYFSVSNSHCVDATVLIQAYFRSPIFADNRQFSKVNLIVTQDESLYLGMMNILLEVEDESSSC